MLSVKNSKRNALLTNTQLPNRESASVLSSTLALNNYLTVKPKKPEEQSPYFDPSDSINEFQLGRFTWVRK